MRIIAGKHKRRQLAMVNKSSTRETSDRVREALFNVLGGTVEGVCLDLFCGSGAYALEALSRGAEFAYCVDSDKDAYLTTLKNAEALNETKHMKIILIDYKLFLKSLAPNVVFDLVFLDPPYTMQNYLEMIENLADHINPLGRVVIESDRKIDLPDLFLSFEKVFERTYGIKKITIYEKSDLKTML